jgi:hypothetical protein
MNKLAFVFVVLGSGLAALGFSGWHANGYPGVKLAGMEGVPWYFDWYFSAGWPGNSQLEITIGVMLLVCGLLLRRDSR